MKYFAGMITGLVIGYFFAVLSLAPDKAEATQPPTREQLVTFVIGGGCLDRLKKAQIQSDVVDAAFVRNLKPCDLNSVMKRKELLKTEHIGAILSRNATADIVLSIPERIWTQEAVVTHVSKHPHIFGVVPYQFKTKENLEIALDAGLRSILGVPPELINDAVIERIGQNYDEIGGVSVDGDLGRETLQLLDDTVITENMALSVVKRDDASLIYVPRSMRTKKVERAAFARRDAHIKTAF